MAACLSDWSLKELHLLPKSRNVVSVHKQFAQLANGPCDQAIYVNSYSGARSAIYSYTGNLYKVSLVYATTVLGLGLGLCPRRWEWEETSGYSYEPASQGQKLRWCYGTLCPVSELHDAVDSQSQLECNSPPVGRPILLHVR